jgi:DNA-binding transcriptional LysR family regulator
MKYTLRQLEVFLATARHENISRAAQDLAMSQSAASDSLRELEHQFDVQLFDRIGKRLQLNDFGRSLLPRAEELLARAQELEASLSTHEESGTLKIGTTFSIGNALCVPLIQQYRQRYPDSQVSVELANTGRISAMVAGFELDLGLIEGEINDPTLEITPWREDELVIFCSPQHPLARKAWLSRQDLLAASWILRESGSGTRQTFDRVLHDLQPQLRIELELQSAEAILQAVRADMGLGCLSLLLLQDAFARGELVPLRARGRDFRRNFYLIIHRQKYRSAAIRHWLQLCKEQATTNMGADALN